MCPFRASDVRGLLIIRTSLSYSSCALVRRILHPWQSKRNDAVFFALWVLNILIQWVASYHTLLMFSWQLTAVCEVGMFLSAAYFARVFLYNRDISFGGKVLLWLCAVATLITIPTGLNVTAYDMENCEGANGVLWDVMYTLEPALILVMMWWGVDAYRQERDRTTRKQIALFTTGMAFFLGTFFLSNFYGELTKFYEFNLWGPIGMAIFLILLGYMIVRYQTFNGKLFATQGLVIGTAVLIGARLFDSTTRVGFMLSAVTLIAFLLSGFFLIRSVKRDIEARVEIERLAQRLKSVNSMLSHDVKATLGKHRDMFHALLAGEFGHVSDTATLFLERSFLDTKKMSMPSGIFLRLVGT